VTDDGERGRVAAWLGSSEASGPLAEAGHAIADHPQDPLGAAAHLRRQRPDLDPTRAAAVLEQAQLRRLAAERYGLAGDLLLTRDGLEQATRPEIAARRAHLIAASGAQRVIDLTGGLGFDAAAFAAAGLTVTAVERDPATAVFLAHNCPSATVLVADATEPGLLPDLLRALTPLDVVFADPARRDPGGPRDAGTGRARPERDPARWSPPWPFIEAVDHPRVAAKVAPGFNPPAGWQAEWTSVDRTLVECAVYSWPVATVDRRAVLISQRAFTIVDAPAVSLPLPVAASLAAWLHEPDPAVLRAGAVPTLARMDPLLASLGAESTWLTSDRPSSSPAARSYLVIDELIGSARQQRRQLAAHRVGRLTVKSRDVAVEPRAVLRDLGVREGPGHVLVMTRRDGRVVSLLTEPAAARSD
jgi:hypothetical protein